MITFSKYLEEKFELTLKYNPTLNKKLWINQKLREGIKEALVKHAYDFAKFSKVPINRIVDIVITGSNCNYNYTKYSDIDVHLICRVSDMNSDSLYDSKVKWTNEHKGLRFKNYPLEFYIENLSGHKPADQGVYSLLNNNWVTIPKHLDNIDILNDPRVLEKIKSNITFIKKSLLKNGTKEQILDFKEKMWRGRSAGLEKRGEFSVENVVYKDLRNRGLIDALNSRLKQL